MDISSVLFTIAEYTGVIAAAISGASVAIACRLDFFGVITLSGVTALGGGCMRDILMGDLPPKMFTSYGYLLCAAVVAVIMFTIAYAMRGRGIELHGKFGRALNLIDAIGLGAFAAAGTGMAMFKGYSDNMFMCVFLGMITGVGGGILRDIMINGIPAVLVKDVYAVAAIAGSIAYYLTERYLPLPHAPTFCCIILTVAIRLLAYHRSWNLPRIRLSGQ